MIYALVDGDGNVVNTILWDGIAPYTPPAGAQAVPAADGASIGWSWSASDGFKAPAVVPPAAPPPPTSISRVAFLARFTRSELLAISAAARANDAINVWLITAQAFDAIDLGSPETKAGLDAMVAAGLLTADRETAILTP